MLVGGGLSSVPRIARDLGIWVPKDEAVTVLAAILDEWREDLRYRVSRVKARLKFMIDDIGPEGMRALVEARLGRTLRRLRAAARRRRRATTSAFTSRSDGRSYVGVPVHLGLVTGDQMIALADLAESVGGDVRMTRQQNFVLTNVADVALVESRRLAEIGLPLDAGALRGDAVACTGEPHCNFSVTETKSRMDGLVQLLEERFGQGRRRAAHASRRLPARVRASLGRRSRLPGHDRARREGKRRQAYDVFLRGSLDRPAAIARPVFRRVPTEELDDAVVGLVGGWVAERGEGETFRTFCDRTTDDDLGLLAGREPAKTRKETDMSVELLDDLEAGELSVEFEGRSRRSCSSGRSSGSRRRSRSRPRSRPTVRCCCTWRTRSIRRSACSASTRDGSRARRSS